MRTTRRNLLKGGGKAVATVAAAAALPILSSINPAQAQEDAELFALYEEWRRLEKVANEGDDDAEWQAVFDVERRFFETPVRTLDGLLFKLRAACLPEVYELEYVQDGNSAPPLQVRAVLRDLERLSGRAI